MMKKWNVLILSFIVASGISFAQVPTVAEQEAAFDQLSIRIKQDSLSGKEVKELGFEDQSEKTDIDFDGFEYILEFRNKSTLDLEGLTIECRFFYTEESHWRSTTMNYNGDGTQAHSKFEPKFYEDSIDLSLAAGERYKVETRPFVIESWALTSGYYFASGAADKVDADPVGLWVRVSYKTSAGETVTRDFYESDSIPSNFSWEGQAI